MIFKKEQYKRLTFVLFIPLLILGFYLKSAGYFTDKEDRIVLSCIAFYDDEKLSIYEPKCEITHSYYFINSILYNGMVFSAFDFDAIVTINGDKVDTTFFSLKDQLHISEIKIKENTYNDDGNEFIAYGNVEPIKGNIYIKDNYYKEVFFHAYNENKMLILKAKILNLLYHYLPIFIPLFMYFITSLLLFILYKIIKYVLLGNK